ncbi:MAG: DUF2993 domain-containing protein [Clostridia bacterium]|nr:DUF2993 domain-containing protein [Clostridia bacterium]
MKKNKAAAFLILVISLLVILPQIVFLPMIEKGLIDVVSRSFMVGKEKVALTLKAKPAVKILWGSFDSFQLLIESPDFGGLPLDTLQMDMGSGKVDLPLFLSKRELKFAAKSRGVGRIVITEDALNDYLIEKYKGFIDNPKAVLGDNEVSIQGSFELMGQRIPIIIWGTLVPEGDSAVIFVPEDIEVKSVRISQGLKNKLLENMAIIFNFDSLPLGAEIAGIEVEEGSLLISMEMHNNRF